MLSDIQTSLIKHAKHDIATAKSLDKEYDGLHTITLTFGLFKFLEDQMLQRNIPCHVKDESKTSVVVNSSGAFYGDNTTYSFILYVRPEDLQTMKPVLSQEIERVRTEIAEIEMAELKSKAKGDFKEATSGANKLKALLGITTGKPKTPNALREETEIARDIISGKRPEVESLIKKTTAEAPFNKSEIKGLRQDVYDGFVKARGLGHTIVEMEFQGA